MCAWQEDQYYIGRLICEMLDKGLITKEKAEELVEEYSILQGDE